MEQLAAATVMALARAEGSTIYGTAAGRHLLTRMQAGLWQVQHLTYRSWSCPARCSRRKLEAVHSSRTVTPALYCAVEARHQRCFSYESERLEAISPWER